MAYAVKIHLKKNAAANGLELKERSFAHIAIEVPAEGSSNEWLEPVSDEDYAKL